MGREFRIKGGEKILTLIQKFSSTEKVVFSFFVICALASSLYLAWLVNKHFLIPVPAYGGTLSEGVVGLPRYINPVLAFTDTDRDLTTLIYSGLMRYDGEKLVPDLAKRYNISEDGLTYTFFLRDNLRFHDGVPLTSDDIEFTIQKAQDAAIKSPHRADWANVTIKKVNPTEIQFILKQPYAPFLANTTLGILPKHIWNKVDPEQFIFSQYNVEPIGSGPYSLKTIQRDSGGIPMNYNLSAFNRFYNKQAFINSISIYFYPNQKALLAGYAEGTIESIARLSANEASRIATSTPSAHIMHTPLPRIFGVFFNQNQAPIFTRTEVRQALNMATDKKAIVRDVLSGYGVVSNSPLPSQSNTKSSERDLDGARALLAKNGWVIGSDGVAERTDKKGTQRLEFSIATVDAPDLKLTAELVKKQWAEIGVRVSIKVFEYGDLYQNIISLRKYDALLFGESINKDVDLYAFWHSSQRNSPGLNVALYVNSKVDKILEQAHTSTDEKERDSLYSQLEKIIQDETPAVFLYSPEFIYVVPDKIHGLTIDYINSASDRFYGINTWYIATDDIWRIINKK